VRRLHHSEGVSRPELHPPARGLKIMDVGILGTEPVDPTAVRRVIADNRQNPGVLDEPPDRPIAIEEVQQVEEVGDQLDRLSPRGGNDLGEPRVHDRDPRVAALTPSAA
jgi:hypothetical protein